MLHDNTRGSQVSDTIPGAVSLRRHRELPVLQLIGAPRFRIYGAANFGWCLIIEGTGSLGCYCTNDPLSTEFGSTVESGSASC
jgi:hypothetical protein